VPIQWYKRPDGTWILWNTDTADAAPIEAPATAGGGGAGQDVARQMLEDQQGGSPGRPQLNASDHTAFKTMTREIHKGKLSDDEKYNMISEMMDKGYVSVDDKGDVWSAFDDKHSDSKKQSILDAIRYWHDRQMDEATNRS
jgi:hypothetical protein